jgi:two-component system sensor histidine kinase TctE
MPVDSPHPWAVIVLAQTNNARMSFAQSLGGKALVVIVAMSALTILAAMFTLYQALAPLKRIEAAIRERDLNDLAPVADRAGRDACAGLAINAFMSGWRYTAPPCAASSAMPRTSCARLSPPGGADGTAGHESSEEKRQRHLALLRERTRHLGALVNQLINHAMVQHRNDSRLQERIDLADLVRSQMTEVLSNRARTPHDLALDVPPCPV